MYACDPRFSYADKALLTAGAAKRGLLDMVKFFHESNDPDFFDSRAMHNAIVHGHLDIVRFLHENRDEGCRLRSLENAYKQGHHHVVDILREHRPVLNAAYLAEFMRRKGFPDLAEKIKCGAAAAVAADRRLY